MKTKLIPATLVCVLAGFTVAKATAEPTPVTVSHGIMFLPPDFYHDHREALGLNEDQLREMQRIADVTNKEVAGLKGDMEERTKALHEVMDKHPANAGVAAAKLRELLEVESVIKVEQLGARIAIRNVLNADQFAKLTQIVRTATTGKEGGTSAKLKEMFEQVKQEIRRRSERGEPPRELMEQLEQIEKSFHDGNLDGAERHLDRILRTLRGESGEHREQGARDEEAERRERSERTEKGPRGEGPGRGEEMERRERPAHGERGGDASLEQRISRLEAVQTDDPDLREHLQQAMARLKEARTSGDDDVIADILNAIESKLPKKMIEKQPR